MEPHPEELGSWRVEREILLKKKDLAERMCEELRSELDDLIQLQAEHLQQGAKDEGLVVSFFSLHLEEYNGPPHVQRQHISLVAHHKRTMTPHARIVHIFACRTSWLCVF